MNRTKHYSIICCIISLITCGFLMAQEPPPAPKAESGLSMKNVADFGPINNSNALLKAFEKALKEMTAANGGILVIPETAPTGDLRNSARWSHSINPASCDLKDWKVGPGVLVSHHRNRVGQLVRTAGVIEVRMRVDDHRDGLVRH